MGRAEALQAWVDGDYFRSETEVPAFNAGWDAAIKAMEAIAAKHEAIAKKVPDGMVAASQRHRAEAIRDALAALKEVGHEQG